MKLEANTPTEMHNAEVPTIQEIDQLMEYIQSCIDAVNSLEEDDEDGYCKCVYAMSMASVATFNHVADALGVTGFQAACADFDILRRTRNIKAPFGLYTLDDLLYPQRDVIQRVQDVIDSDTTKEWLKEEAKKRIEETKGEEICPDVMEHWLKLAREQNNANETR